MFNNKTILVTGGTGSFGKSFITKVLNSYSPKKIIIYSRDELKQYEMQVHSFFSKHERSLRYFLGDVRDFDRLKTAVSEVDIVIHAAALKQVPAAEYNPFEAIKTNIHGAQNLVQACLDQDIEKVIALSTDKAAAPINLYGATKLVSDKLFVSANLFKGSKKTKFSVVRYGNVMGSRGSVIPAFLKMKENGLLTITDAKMTRFNITLDDGVQFVFDSLDRMVGGEIFIPKIPSYRILDVAKAIDPNLKTKMIGIRPGEKLHEEMITESDSFRALEFKSHFVILPSTTLWDEEVYRKSNKNDIGVFSDKPFSYNSENNSHFLTVDEISDLIKNHVI
jgi:UDP-N-acetylglucosamine 4,6-dehydratase/5-epimerase